MHCWATSQMLPPCAHLLLQVRADLNVPLDKDLKITDDTRVRAAIPTLKYLSENGAKVLLTSHLVRTCSAPAQAGRRDRHTLSCAASHAGRGMLDKQAQLGEHASQAC